MSVCIYALVNELRGDWRILKRELDSDKAQNAAHSRHDNFCNQMRDYTKRKAAGA